MILFKNLEELLLKNWTTFLDVKRLTALVLSIVRDGEFETATSETKYGNNLNLKLSRFELVETGFLVWVEFVVPREEGVVIGTTELTITAGQVIPGQTTGRLVKRS